MKISVRISIKGLKVKVNRMKGAIPEEAKRALQEMALEAYALVEQNNDELREQYYRRQISRQLTAIFVPVMLKHQRREQFPNLLPIYRARILDHQKTFMGRKRFYVDEDKEDALYQQLLQQALVRHPQATYEIRFVPAYGGRHPVYRVEIIRHGHGPRRDEEVMLAFVKQRIKYISADTIRRSLSKAGLNR